MNDHREIPQYYIEHEKKAIELVKCWFWAMIVCIVLCLIYGLIT